MISLAYIELTRIEPEKQNIKFASVVSLILTTCVLFLTPHLIAAAQTIDFPDPNLRAALEAALDKAAGADIAPMALGISL